MKSSYIRNVGIALCGIIMLAVTSCSATRHTAATIVVTLTDADQYVPAHLRIQVGDTVRWINASQTIHTVTDVPKLAAYHGDAQLPSGGRPFNSGFLKPGATYTHTFTVAGIYRYFCIPHESLGMLGTIEVIPAGNTTHNKPSSAAQSLPPASIGAGIPSISSKELAPLFPTRVYVTLQRTGAVEEFPQQIVWTGFPQAHYISVGPGGKLLLVGGFQNGNVYIASGMTGRVLATLHIGGLIQGVKIDPVGIYGLAVDAGKSQVAVINLKTRRIARSISVGKTPHNAVFSKSGSLAYVTIQGGRAIDVIDMHKLAVIRTIPLPQVNGPHNLDRTTSGKTLWIRSHANPNVDGEVAVVNLATGHLEGITKVGFYHGGIDIRPAGMYVFTTNIGANTVSVIDPHSYRVIDTLVVGAGPHGIRESANGRWIYAATTRANTLVIINVRTLGIAKTIPLKGEDPFWLAVVGNE